MNSHPQPGHLLQRWRRRLGARLARPRPPFFLSPEQGTGAWADWCQAHAGAAAEIVVSARLLHELVCEPGLPLADEAALQAYARQLFGHYFGAAAKAWPLAGWSAGAQRGASALHGVELPALRQLAANHDVELRRLRPAWAPLLQRLAVEQPDWLRAPQAGLAWVEGQVLTWLRLSAGQLLELRQLRLAEATPTCLGETLAELRGTDSGSDSGSAVLVQGYGLASGALPAWPGVRVLGRLDGMAPLPAWFELAADAPGALPQPDFLGPRIRRSALAWPLAATGALVLATAGWSAADSHQVLDTAQAQHERLGAALRREPRPVPAVALAAGERSPSARQAEQEQLRSAAEVQGLLRQAWEPLLTHIETAGSAGAAPASAISWLGLDYSAGRNELRLEGLTQDKPAALQLVDHLAAAPGWRDVVLSRFQTGEQGLTGQRFELSAKLRPELLQMPETPQPAAPAAKDAR